MTISRFSGPHDNSLKPTLYLVQLNLFTAVAVNYAPPAMSKYRRRLAKVAAMSYRLGTIRAERRHLAERPARSLSSAAVVSMPARAEDPGLREPSRTLVPAPVMPASGRQPIPRDERHEIGLLARRVGRLSISRRDPEFFYCERSEIVDALKQIARRY